MPRKALIKIRRGTEAQLPTLDVGELGFCTDTNKLYIGTPTGNQLLVAAQSVGDMLKSIYDTDNDGIVDNADKLDGKHASSFVQTTGDQTISGTKTFDENIYARKYYVNTNGVPSSNLGNPTVQEMALFQEEFNNKLEFYDISKFTFKYTLDGTTWIDDTANISDTDKKRFVGGDYNADIIIPNGAQKYRITIRNNGNYVYINALYMYWSSNGHRAQVHIWKKRDGGDWVQHTSSSTTVSGWPGHLYLPFSTIPWSLSSTSGHYHEIGIEFIPTWDPSYPSNNIGLRKLQLWGGYPAGKRTIYTVDENKNVTFPANVTANDFYVGSNKVWHAGNFDPNTKLNKGPLTWNQLKGVI